MRRSKLEIYLEILRVMNSKGPIDIVKLGHETKVKGEILRERLEFLIARNLVEQQLATKDEGYTITAKGQKVLRIITPIVTQARQAKAILH